MVRFNGDLRQPQKHLTTNRFDMTMRYMNFFNEWSRDGLINQPARRCVKVSTENDLFTPRTDEARDFVELNWKDFATTKTVAKSVGLSENKKVCKRSKAKNESHEILPNKRLSITVNLFTAACASKQARAVYAAQ